MNPTPPHSSYRVLARVHRPARFEDLLGQEAMVRTLRNAFAAERIPHAVMLTGVRGVGKTTTARLLARALNYHRDGADAPSMDLDPPGTHCDTIAQSRHPDVLELDAASRTGVADMRELLDGVSYAPVSARYRIYIIDEVHMLSMAAFNALLKTLEEPPGHVKFIFATTEVQKVPVTVLSRCMRFGLSRLDVETLSGHLQRVCELEKVAVDAGGLTLVARAAEGSARDALSILDRVIVNARDGPVTAEAVRDMLGLADRARILDLLTAAMSGDNVSTLERTESLLRDGADAHALLRELLDAIAELGRADALGDGYTCAGPTDWSDRTRKMAAASSTAQIARAWRIALGGIADCSVAPEPEKAACMVCLRLAAACALPFPEQAARAMLNHPRVHEAFEAFPEARLLSVKPSEKPHAAG